MSGGCRDAFWSAVPYPDTDRDMADIDTVAGQFVVQVDRPIAQGRRRYEAKDTRSRSPTSTR